MNRDEGLAASFESHRDHLRGVAYRLLGSLDEADDAVQQAWLRAQRADRRGIENLAGWLTTITARVSLDMLRTRRRRGERPLPDAEGAAGAGPADASGGAGATGGGPSTGGHDPAGEAVLAESVGLALLVVLDRLSPAQRVAFVLHDMFTVPFDEIGPVVGRSTVATKKLASRARERVRGAPTTPEAGERELSAPRDPDQRRAVVEAFLAAARGGDVGRLLHLLAPDVVRRADRVAIPAGVPTELRGADAVADETRLLAARAASAEVAIVDGEPGIVVAPHGRLFAVIRVSVDAGRVTAYEVVAEPARLAGITLAVPAS
jgi:RNA polymerase sigma-70 factor (ECF subfamily)